MLQDFENSHKDSWNRSPETAFYSKVNLFLSEKYNVIQIKSDWYFFYQKQWVQWVHKMQLIHTVGHSLFSVFAIPFCKKNVQKWKENKIKWRRTLHHFIIACWPFPAKSDVSASPPLTCVSHSLFIKFGGFCWLL